MPLPPLPAIYRCKTCGYTKVVKIKSDALTPADLTKLNSTCPICGSKMDKKILNFFDTIKKLFK